MWTPQLKKWVADLKNHAVKNYNQDGWDYLVETYSDTDILMEIRDCECYEDAFERMADNLKLLDDNRKEIQSTAF
jgi:hypothetical protein